MEENEIYEFIKEQASQAGFNQEQLDFMLRLFTTLIETAIMKAIPHKDEEEAK